MNRLKEAIIMATLAHGDTLDKSGELYILHPLRVMLDPSLTTEDERITAVLHDVLEDTNVTNEDILQKFGPEVLSYVQGVSRGYISIHTGRMIFKEPMFHFAADYAKEIYMDFIDRAGMNPVSRSVKIADLKDNCLPIRRAKLGPKMASIESRYKKALFRLGVLIDWNI
jgi:hypothetical protein